MVQTPYGLGIGTVTWCSHQLLCHAQLALLQGARQRGASGAYRLSAFLSGQDKAFVQERELTFPSHRDAITLVDAPLYCIRRGARAIDLDRDRRRTLDLLLHQPIGCGAEQDTPRRCPLLKLYGQVRGVPHTSIHP